jgi:hypothetical protein
VLEQTYSAKALAACLAEVAAYPTGISLFVHTASSAPLDSLLDSVPEGLPAELDALLTGTRG